MFVNIKKLDISHEEETLILYSDSLKYHDYFQESFGELSVDSNLYTSYRQAIEYMLKQGHCYGAFVRGIMVGCILSVDYDLLRNENAEVFEMFFKTGEPYYEAVTEYTESILNDTYFIVAVAITPNYRNKGIASRLLRKFCKDRVSGETIITDCYEKTRPHLFSKQGFIEVDVQGENIITLGVRRF